MAFVSVWPGFAGMGMNVKCAGTGGVSDLVGPGDEGRGIGRRGWMGMEKKGL